MLGCLKIGIPIDLCNLRRTTKTMAFPLKYCLAHYNQCMFIKQIIKGKKRRENYSPAIKWERNQLCKWSRKRAGTSRRRRRRRITTYRTRCADSQPLINAISMKAVIAFRNTPYRILWPVLRQANAARAVIGPRQTPAFPKHYLWIRIYHRWIQADNHHHTRGIFSRGLPISFSTTVVLPTGERVARLYSDTNVRSKHDSGNENKNAHSYGYAITKAYSAGCFNWIRRGHEKRERERERAEWVVRMGIVNIWQKTVRHGMRVRGEKINRVYNLDILIG